MAEEEMSSSSRRVLAVALENETAVLSKLVKGKYIALFYYYYHPLSLACGITQNRPHGNSTRIIRPYSRSRRHDTCPLTQNTILLYNSPHLARPHRLTIRLVRVLSLRGSGRGSRRSWRCHCRIHCRTTRFSLYGEPPRKGSGRARRKGPEEGTGRVGVGRSRLGCWHRR